MEAYMKTHNFQLVNVDTDAISYCNYDGSPINHELFVKHLQEINDFLPELIEMENDGEFESFVVVKAKNYIMRYFCPKKGKIVQKFKGSGLLSSKTEPAMREMLKEVGISLLENGIDYSLISNIYIKYINEAKNPTDIKRWSKKMTLTKKVLNAATDPNARTNEKKPWEAVKDKNLQEGDKFWVYPSKAEDKHHHVKGVPQFKKKKGVKKADQKPALPSCTHKPHLTCVGCNPDFYEPKMVENIILKCAEDYKSDEHVPKLLERVYATISIFDSILDMSNFLNYSKPKNLEKLEERNG